MKKCYIEHLGCAKNQVDAEVMLEALMKTGEWEHTAEPDEADLILVNTCGFIEAARKESIDAVFDLREAFPEKRIIMTGCLSERYGKEMAGELVEADGFFGNRDLAKIVDAAQSALQGERPLLIPDTPVQEFDERRTLFTFPGSAYVKLSEGCNHRCSYCAIPLIRGDLKSRPFDSIVNEVSQLVTTGTYEINLIAQDLAAYGTDRGDGTSEFMQLLEALCSLPLDFRIRLLYIHPDAFPEELPAFIAAQEKMHPYFDIPFQHASVPILRKMGRTGSPEVYLSLLARIRETLPEAVIRSTFLLGFPGEEKEDFETLLAFVEAAKLDWAGTFLYSREEGTPAFALRGARAHNKALKQAAIWKQELEQVQQSITEKKLAAYAGSVFDVLLEEKIEGEELIIGRMYGQAPEVDGLTVVMTAGGEPGDVVTCGITRSTGVDLEAVPVKRGVFVSRYADRRM